MKRSHYRRRENVGLGAIAAVWVIGVLLNLAFWGVVVWAIIKVVSAVTK